MTATDQAALDWRAAAAQREADRLAAIWDAPLSHKRPPAWYSEPIGRRATGFGAGRQGITAGQTRKPIPIHHRSQNGQPDDNGIVPGQSMEELMRWYITQPDIRERID